MIYTSIIPTEMTNQELRSICGCLQVAKNQNLQSIIIDLKNGLKYNLEVERLRDYQQTYQTETGKTLVVN